MDTNTILGLALGGLLILSVTLLTYARRRSRRPRNIGERRAKNDSGAVWAYSTIGSADAGAGGCDGGGGGGDAGCSS